MNHKKLQLVGTHGGGWREEIQETLGSAGFLVAAAELDAIVAADADDYLVIVEHPVAALAASLEVHPETGLAAWIDAWESRAQQLTRMLQRQPSRCLFLRLEEAECDMPAFVGALQARFGVRVAADAPPVRRALDPVAVAIARAALSRRASFWALAAELDAACLTLSSQSLLPAVYEGRPQTLHADLGVAWEGYVGVRRERQSEQSSHQAEQAASTRVVEQLRAELVASGHRLDAAAAERNAAQRSLAGSSSQLDAVRRQLADTDQENRQLLLHLHEVQELLETEIGTQRVQATRVSGLEGTLSLNGITGMLFERVQLLAERNEAPYRELDIALVGPASDGGAPQTHDIRLVEHRGHPGLVVFANAEGPRLFGAWQETGREAERPFMLLVPNDAAGAQLLDQLPRTDHHRLVRILENVQRALEASQTHARWIAVVRRLRVEVLERSDRLRYDDLQVRPVDDAPSVLNVEFLAVEFGARQWSKLNVWWQPGDARPLSLRLSDIPGDMPPLKGWMSLSTADEPLQSWPVPLADAPGGSSGLTDWRRLDAADRELLAALLDAMPAASLQAIDKGLVAESENERLLAASHELLQRVPVEPPPLQGRMRRLRKMLRSVAPAKRRDETTGALP